MPTKKSKKRATHHTTAKSRTTTATRVAGRTGTPVGKPGDSATSATSQSGATPRSVLADMEAAIADISEAMSRLQGKSVEREDKCEVRSVECGVRSEEQNNSTLQTPNSTLNPEATPNDVATFLQTWLDELQIMYENFAELVPQLETTLTTAERRRLNGSGVRRYGFIEKVIEVAAEYPQFWPAFFENGDKATLRRRVREIDVLRNLLIWFRYAARTVGDMLLLSGDDAFRLAGVYYGSVRDSARRKIPEAQQVFQMLQLFWKRRRRASNEPTERELERDFNALMRGRKNGKMMIANAELSGRSTDVPHMTGGVREVIDDVRSAKRRASGAKIKVEEGE